MTPTKRNQSPQRGGYTLLETVISLGAASLLCGGMASALHVAGRGMEAGQSSPAVTSDAVVSQRQLLRDLQHALRFSERTPHAVTFLVPDRTGDGRPDEVRYAWSGTPGDPLTYRLNNATPVTVVSDVQTLNFNYETRTLTAPELVINESPASDGSSSSDPSEGTKVAASVDGGGTEATASTSGSTDESLNDFLEENDTGNGKGKGKGKKK